MVRNCVFSKSRRHAGTTLRKLDPSEQAVFLAAEYYSRKGHPVTLGDEERNYMHKQKVSLVITKFAAESVGCCFALRLGDLLTFPTL
jgi:hypothetical protein